MALLSGPTCFSLMNQLHLGCLRDPGGHDVLAAHASSASDRAPSVSRAVTIDHGIPLLVDPTLQVQALVSREEAQALADSLGAFKYFECSAETQEGLKEVRQSELS